jgi:poly(3-hydroxyalkanoate) depolymerase
MTTAQRALRRVLGQELRVDVRHGGTNGGTAGTPLLLLSGIGIGYEVFDRFVATLDPGIEVIRVDVPGVGGSPVPLFPAGFPQLAVLLAALLDDLGYRSVDVLGFSWGGALAQQFAVQYPGRCRRLILMSTSPGIASIPGEPQVLGKMLAPQDFADARRAAGMMYGKDPDAHIDDVRQLFRNSAATSSGLGYLYQLAAVACWTSLFFLPLIRQPTLVMGGDSDPLVPVTNAGILAGLIPNATLEVYSGGHIEPLADPSIASSTISHFLG